MLEADPAKKPPPWMYTITGFFAAFTEGNLNIKLIMKLLEMYIDSRLLPQG